jgi:ferric-dicitrate binding protein FerR (iron transport regulator)
MVDKKQNELLLLGEIKPLWEENMHEDASLPNPKQEVFQKIRNTILSEEQKTTQRKLKIYSYGLKIAAVLVIGLIISTVFFSQRAEQNQSTAQTITIRTPFGAKTSTALPDGSLVWLNSGSSLSFPAGFGKSRPVKLTGEAYFEVVKSDKPFIVSTSYGDVEVKGTSFNVKAFPDDNSFETTLVEGIVIVSDKNTSDEVALIPGQQAVNSKNGFNVQNVETSLFTSWKEGKLIFRKEYLPEVARRLERWYNVKIELDNDKRLTEIWYAGTIEMESFTEVLELLQVTAPVTFTFNDKTRTIKINYKQK